MSASSPETVGPLSTVIADDCMDMSTAIMSEKATCYSNKISDYTPLLAVGATEQPLLRV